MAHWRLLTALALAAATLAACSGGEAGAPTTTGGPAPLTFHPTINDSGQGVLQLHPGDEVAPRLPLNGLQVPGWVLTLPPNPAVLRGGDDLRFFPSETGQGGAGYQEFSFSAVGPGRTSFTLTHGFQQFTCTVEVAPAG